MANVIHIAVDRRLDRMVLALLRRTLDRTVHILADVGREIAAAREDLRWHQALQAFDRERLRDLGLDRDAF